MGLDPAAGIVGSDGGAGVTKIEWTNNTWNPTTGCSKVSDGCKNCYAARMARRLAAMGKPGYTALPWTAANAAANVVCHPKRLEIPLRWRKPRRIFVDSMSDLFHEQVPDAFIERVFRIMMLAGQHTYQILTKRPGRMLAWVTRWLDDACWPATGCPMFSDGERMPGHIWLGVSVENQAAADERIPLLLRTPAAVRFLSCEPLLGPLNVTRYLLDGAHKWEHRIHWLIAGGESGPGARPMHPNWARSLRDQCQAAGVPFFFKQWGGWDPHIGGLTEYGAQELCARGGGRVAKGYYIFDDCAIVTKTGGKYYHDTRELDGREWNEYPEMNAS